MISLGSSELLEQLVLQILTHGRYRRHLRRLHERLAATHARVAQSCSTPTACNWHSGRNPACFSGPRLPSKDSVGKLWRRALSEGVLLAPGELFRPDGRASAQWRFNVAHCDAPALYRFLEAL
jgi:DNA-binding transcriptional MocR family regulator